MADLKAAPVGDRSWRADAACLNHPEDLWFSFEPEKQAQAVAICGCCAVREQCLAFALSVRPSTSAGIWGGRDFWKSKALRRRLQRQAKKEAEADVAEPAGAG